MAVTDPPRRSGVATRIYSAWAWSTFVICLSAAFAGAALLPGLERRRRWVGACARGFFLLAGIRVRVSGSERLPQGHCVVIANHASYLDGVLLQAFLPPRFSYVIKSEMERVPLGGFMLRRIGSRFVERFATTGSARDARTLLRAANSGEALAFFPEGTFRPEPGLRRFRPGAFVAAIRSSVPLVPVAIRGSRRVLPSGTLLARRGPVDIEILPPIGPDEPDYEHHRRLADAARNRILRVLGEPDLAGLD